jgi:AraC-like DNA-binding protein
MPPDGNTIDAGEAPARGGAPVVRRLGHGKGWRVDEFVCTAGPDDRPFEEQHEHVTIAAVVQGSFTYRGDTGSALLHPGAFLFGNPGACFECGHDHGVGDRCISFQVAAEYFSEIAAAVAGSARYRFTAPMLPATPRLLPWLTRIEARAASWDRMQADEAVPGLIEAVVAAMSGNVPGEVRASARTHRRVSDVLRHIETNADERLDLDDLAAMAGMSKYHFLRSFRAVVGMTPYQFLLSLRVRLAANRLIVTPEPVANIAFAAGFGDLSSFNARFRAIFGMSPTAYRRCERA